MRILGAVVLSLTLIPAWPSTSEAQRRKEFAKGPVGKAVSACGVKIIPLVVGNQWTYEFVQAPVPPREEMVKLSPSQPMKIVIAVKSIEPRGADTVVTLEEKTTADLSRDPKKHILDERTINSTITCSATKFEISPDSFFFAGEPGGYFGITFDKLERPKDTTWKLVNGTIGDAEWREDIVAHFTRTATSGVGAKLDGGKIELERKFTPAEPGNIHTKVGVYNAERLGILTTGRVTLDHPQPDVKPMELPVGWVNQLWLVNNVGVIQALNSYAHMYMLTDVQLK